MPKFTALCSPIMPLPINNIDTDQIIPARFLKTTDKAGMGENLFADWRYTADGSPNPDFALNKPQYQRAHILLAGDNFGCGSSREHAPWALLGAGFRAVISTSFADIFYNNALKNGLLAVALDRSAHQELFDLLSIDPQAEISVDLASQTVSTPAGRTYRFQIDNFARTCLLNGVDQLGYLLGFEKQIENYERTYA
jgi:3-isopropylmalate/(R)-2-methylmalate dehydratase small subunit